MKTTLSIIVAIAEDYGIGKDNDLLFHIPGDLPRFKKITSGHTVIMGKNTYISLPKGALPNRKNIVISDKKEDCFDNCIMANSIEEAIEKCGEETEAFIIGGGMIYKQFLPIADKLYLTKVHQSPKADTFFPEIDYNKWDLMEEETHTDVNPPHTYLIYQKI
jgi:dihydrofolate reductase